METLSRTQKWGIFINSLSLFILTFLITKLVVIGIKFLIALIFHIDVTILHYRLIDISPSFMDIWNYFPIIILYIADILVSLILFIISYKTYSLSTEEQNITKIFFLWMGFNSLFSLYSAIISGVLANSSVFQFLNWIYVPYYVMLIIAVFFIVVAFISGFWYNKFFLDISPSEIYTDTYKGQKIVLKYSVFYPIVLGLFILVVLMLPKATKYDIYELVLLLLMGLPALLYSRLKAYNVNEIDFSTNVYKGLIKWAIAFWTLFLVLNLHILLPYFKNLLNFK